MNLRKIRESKNRAEEINEDNHSKENDPEQRLKKMEKAFKRHRKQNEV